MIALDTETTGLDFPHGCRPFFVSITDQDLESMYWEWRVDPYTRNPTIPKKDIKEVKEVIQDHGHVIMHNAKFDARALESIGISLPDLIGWENIEDTILYSHLSDSQGPHGLKPLAERLIGFDTDDEQAVKVAVEDCRRQMRPHVWAIAAKGHHHFPSLEQGKWWKMDMWLPREVAIFREYAFDHPYYTVLSTYGVADPYRTMLLYQHFQKELISG